MNISLNGALRRFILALAFGVVLVPFAPDANSVSAHQASIMERVAAAHSLAGAN